MTLRPANDFIFEIDLDAADVALLEEAGVDDADTGVSQLDSNDAWWLQDALIRAEPKLYTKDGQITAQGRRVVSLLSKLQDDPSCAGLRRRAAEGDAHAALELAKRKMTGPAYFLYPEETARLLMQAHLAGLAEATRELADVRGDVRLEVGFGEDQRLEVLERAALDGDPGTALEVLYGVQALPRERLIAVLRAVRDGSTEAAEWLEKLEAES